MKVYYIDPTMAEPVDTDEVFMVRHAIRTWASESGHPVYEPQAAWNWNSIADVVAPANKMAMATCDAVIAFQPSGPILQSVETQIAWAVAQRKPIFYLNPTTGYLRHNVHRFASWEALAPALADFAESLAEQKRPQRLMARFTRGAPGKAPVQGHPDDAGFDLAYSGGLPLEIGPGDQVAIPCSVAIQWPPGVWGFLVGRSSAFVNRGLLVNPGIIDPGFRGELFANARNIGVGAQTILPGERVAQIIPLPALAPDMDMVEVDQLDPTERGTNGWGSTGQ